MKLILQLICANFIVSCGGAEPGLDGKDLIVVSIDTLRADRLPFYGAERETAGNPREKWSLAWIAANGRVYDQVWAPASMTRPSFASLWTGKHALEHGTVGNHQMVTAPLLSEELAADGYRGTAAVANWVLRPESGLGRGFDYYDLFLSHKEPEIPRTVIREITGGIHASEKQFIWAHFMAPHQPYTPNNKFRNVFVDTSGIKGDKKTLAQLHRAPNEFGAAQVEQLRALYDGEILTTNEYVVKLLSGIEKLYQAAGRGDLLDNAVIVMVSDHGEELAYHENYFMHSKSLYAGVTQVPLVIIGNGFEVGRHTTPIGIEEVLPLVINGKRPDSDFFVATWHNRFFVARDSRYTLIHNPAQNQHGPSEPPGDVDFYYPPIALFDRESDPLELNDISQEFPGITRAMMRKLVEWHAIHAIGDSTQEELNADDAAKLAELGYASATEDVDVDDYAPWPPERWDG